MTARTLRIVVLCCLLTAACGVSQATEMRATRTSPATPAPGELSGPLTVFAAASLTDAFEALAADFERAHPAVAVRSNFAGSSTLAAQIAQGAPADVFAPANGAQMAMVDDAGLVDGQAVDFAGNSLEIVVEAGNPLRIATLRDLARDDVTVVLAAEEVPAGEYARAALDAQRIAVRPASLEPDVRAVLTRVGFGEADAGVVYASDVATAGDDVEGVAIPPEQNVSAAYPIAVLADAPNPAAARAFVDLVRSPAGQRRLRAYGFTPP